MSYFLKSYKNAHELLVAVCDKDILGRTFDHNGLKLNISDKFYGNDEYSEDEVLQELKRCTSANVFGRNICTLLIENGMIHPNTILWLKDGDKEIGHAILIK
ncbi:MAG: DUF424 family protein [Candidatus Heimdallarchaeota archaeon]|nr:DUF424 family protein [Candidatus Heimdallarchaeota archaeon]